MDINTHTRNTELTRETLLRSAFCEIHRNGFQGASVANILQSTGLTKGALYHHFSTKHALGLAVIDDIIAPFISQVLLAPIQHSDQPTLTLINILLQLGDTMGEEKILLGCPLNNLMQEMSPLDDDFRQHLHQVLTHWQSVLQQTFEHDQQRGVVRHDVDCRAAALFVQSAWEGCIGVAKTMQSISAFQSCMQQLANYVRSLMVSGVP